MKNNELGKRDRLIAAAKKLSYYQGFNRSPLAEIAVEANVPLGNIYYYFKTKEELGLALIESLAEEYRCLFARLNEVPNPKARLLLFLNHDKESLILISKYGSELGSLCQELGKAGGNLANQVAKILFDTLTWCEKQFEALGFNKPRAVSLALHFISTLQGAYLLACSFKDLNLPTREIEALREWINTLVMELSVKSSHLGVLAQV